MIKRISILFAFMMCFCVYPRSQVIYDEFRQLEQRLENGGDTLFMINFWATWCKPCVEELPLLESYDPKNIAPQKLHVLLISLDFKNQVNQQVIPFIKSKKIKHEVIVLADPDSNDWIPKIDESWDGAIPVTLLWMKGRKPELYNKVFNNSKEINTWVQSYIEK